MSSSVVMKNYKKLLFQGNIDMDSNTFYVSLLNGTSAIATSAFESMISFSAAQIYETSGTGYTANGIALTANDISLNGSTAIWDCLDVTWSNSTISSDGCVIYRLVTNANDSPLVCYLSFSGVQSSTNGDFTLQWNSLGILNLIS